jgi:predicted transglutaminase-like cysteine proteinase
MSNERGVVEKINRQVNDLGLHETVDNGVGEVPGGCRLSVLEKQKRLIAAGIAPSRLQPYTVAVQNGPMHGVLLLDNDTVLDSLNPWPTPKADLEKGPNRYFFIAPWGPAEPAAPARPSPHNALATLVADKTAG